MSEEFQLDENDEELATIGEQYPPVRATPEELERLRVIHDAGEARRASRAGIVMKQLEGRQVSDKAKSAIRAIPRPKVDRRAVDKRIADRKMSEQLVKRWQSKVEEYRKSMSGGKLPRDGNNNGMIFDGTPQERPAPTEAEYAAQERGEKIDDSGGSAKPSAGSGAQQSGPAKDKKAATEAGAKPGESAGANQPTESKPDDDAIDQYEKFVKEETFAKWSKGIDKLESLSGKDISSFLEEMPYGTLEEQAEWFETKSNELLGTKLEWEPEDDYSADALEKKAAESGEESEEDAAKRREWSKLRDGNRRTFRDAIASSNVSTEKRKEYMDSMQKALNMMPQASHAAVAQNLKESEWHESTSSITKVALPMLGGVQLNDGEQVQGLYIPGKGGSGSKLHLDGGVDPVGTYVHEMAHVMDRDDNGGRISDSQEWQDAWQSEIVDAPFPDYGKTSASEGFAEFARLAYKYGPDKVLEKFPKSSAVFRQYKYF
jgi:hypothetical protein